MDEIQLRAGDAKQRDVGRGIARLDQATMQKLSISAGDVRNAVSLDANINARSAGSGDRKDGERGYQL